MDGHGHVTAACEARNGDPVQPAVPIIICDEIGGGKGLVIDGFSALSVTVMFQESGNTRPAPLLAQNLQKGVFSIQQIGNGVGFGSALTVGAVRQIQVSIPVRLAIPGGIAVPAVDLKAVPLYIAAVRGFPDGGRTGMASALILK